MENNQNNISNSLKSFERFFLQGRAIDLFLLLVGIFVGEIAIAGAAIFFYPKLALVVISFVTLLSLPIFFIWFNTLGTNLYLKLPSGNNIKIGLFKFNLIYFCIYFISFTINSTFGGSINFGLLFLFHLCAMFSELYVLYFVSKLLVSVEKQQVAKFHEYFLTLLMILYFPIGIWFLQPRIQKIFSSGT